jgi:hypothetical protein
MRSEPRYEGFEIAGAVDLLLRDFAKGVACRWLRNSALIFEKNPRPEFVPNLAVVR